MIWLWLCAENDCDETSTSISSKIETGRLSEFETKQYFSAFCTANFVLSLIDTSSIRICGNNETEVKRNLPSNCSIFPLVVQLNFETGISNICEKTKNVFMKQLLIAERKKCSGVHSPPSPPNTLGL